MKKIEVNWSGTRWSLCCGEWTISIDGKRVDLPEGVRKSHMNTSGTWPRWYFGKNYEEIWEDYEDGLQFPEWLKENSWVDSLNLSDDEKEDLYSKIHEQDWRHGMCGGCI